MVNNNKIRVFELKKGLYITPDNYTKFARTFEKALSKNKKKFPFRNHTGKLYIIETDYVKFALKTLQEQDHEELIKKANQYKRDEEKLSKEEFELKQKQYLEQYKEEERIRSKSPKLYDLDGQVINKQKSIHKINKKEDGDKTEKNS